MSVQLISQNGKPEYAVLPYQDYLDLLKNAGMLKDIQTYDEVKKSISKGDEELIPAFVAEALADNKNPIKVWREYRGFTQHQLAVETGISVPFVSQLETAKRKASIDIMKKLATSLHVDIEDLV